MGSSVSDLLGNRIIFMLSIWSISLLIIVLSVLILGAGFRFILNIIGVLLLIVPMLSSYHILHPNRRVCEICGWVFFAIFSCSLLIFIYMYYSLYDV